MPDLWVAYRDTADAAVRQQLIEQYAPLAKYVVDRLHLQPSGGVSYDDLLGQAIIGLIEAIDRYDPARGVKFNTYAYYRIRGAVMDMLRELDWVPRSLRARSTEILGAVAQLEAELGRQPTDEEIAGFLGITLEQFDGLAQDIAGQSLLSLDEAFDHSTGDGHQIIGDLVPDENTISPEQFTEDEDQRRVLAEAIDALGDNERLVISLYYHEGLTLKEIGKVLNVTESRVCQIHSKAILRLRSKVQAAYIC